MQNSTKLKELRKSLNLSQLEFAAKIGVSQGTIGDIERGRIGVSKNVKSKIFDFIGVESGYFDGNKLNTEDALNQGSELGYIEDLAQKQLIESNNVIDNEPELSRIAKKWRRTPEEQVIWEREIDKRYRKLTRYNNMLVNDLEEQSFELKRLFSSLKNIASLEDVHYGIQESSIGAMIRESLNVYKEKYKDLHGHPGPVEYLPYAEYKAKMVDLIEAFLPYALIFNKFSDALNDFLSELRKVAKEIKYSDDDTSDMEDMKG